MYNVKSGEQYAKITITDAETVKFSDKWDVFGVKGDDITVKLNSTDSGDGVYNTDDTGGAVIIAHGRRLDTMYLTGTGDVIVWAGASAVDCPFKPGAKGGGDSGDGTHYKGTTTTALTDGSTTNPITILIEDEPVTYTAVMGDIVVYGSSEFIFDSNAWKEIGRGVDTVPTKNSANTCTSDGIYMHTAGEKIYVNNALKGEKFNNAKEASGQYSHAEGDRTTASGQCSHAEGSVSKATGTYSHAEGDGAKASGQCSHAEGKNTTSSGQYSHAEGTNTTASGLSSHAEGMGATASGWFSHSEGYYAEASETSSHAEGESTIASGDCSHAEGIETTASGNYSHAGGKGTNATQEAMTAIGKYNSPRTGDLFNIGNGTSNNTRSNILEADSTSVNINGDIQRDGVGIDDYTTTERKIGKWIDGSDLYQRTFEVTELTNGQWNNSVLGTSGINIVDAPLGTIYWLYNDAPDIVSSINYYRNNTEFSTAYINATTDDVNVLPKIDDSGYTIDKAIITIKYTKPSAQANLMQTAPTEEVSETLTVEEDDMR